MPLSRDFKKTVQERAIEDEAFRHGLLSEGLECIFMGDVDTGKSLIRDYINATIGFETLGEMTQKSPKSLMRMLSPSGNPNFNNLVDILRRIQEYEHIQFEIKVEPITE